MARSRAGQKRYTLRAFARAIREAVPENREAMADAVEKAILFTQQDAKARIGHYQIGWAPLKQVTVTQKVHLGYAPPDNPLLRTGEGRESIMAQVNRSILRGAVYTNSKAMAAQESGAHMMVGSTEVTLPPRPFLYPATLEGRELLIEMLEEILRNPI